MTPAEAARIAREVLEEKAQGVNTPAPPNFERYAETLRFALGVPEDEAERQAYELERRRRRRR